MADNETPDLDAAAAVTTVFFSYTRADQKRALPIIAALEASGFKVWWDGLLEGGVNFLPTTDAALQKADAVIVLWSKTSIGSNWVRDEATVGRDRRCLVPLSLDGTEPPLGFRQFQVIDISRWRGKAGAPEMDRVARAVAALGGREHKPLPAPTPPFVTRRTMIGGGLAISAVAGAVLWQGGWIGSGTAGENSIAVLPFRNQSQDAEQGYFSDGLSEELRSILSRNRMLRVSAPTSSVGLRDEATDAMAVARKLGVAYVLRGSVQRAGQMVRIAAELIDGKDAVVRWSQIFNREMRDVFALQSEIANTVAIALVAEVAGQASAEENANAQQAVGGTENVAAYDAYLRGRALVEKNAGETTDRAALAQFDTAISIDPNYAAAHALRASMLAAIANQTDKPDEVRGLYDASIAAAQRAISLAPKLAMGHDALGFALNNGRLDTGAARTAFTRARDLAPGDADILRSYATFSAYDGSPTEAAPPIERAMALDPLNARVFRSAGNIAYAAHDYPATIRWMEKAQAMNAGISIAHFAIGNARLMMGDAKAAVTAYQAEPVTLFGLTGLAIAHHRLGSKSAAKAAFGRIVSEFGNNGLYQQAQVLIQWGDTAGGLNRLEQAWALKDSGLLLARTDPMLDPVRKQPRFMALLSALDGRKS